MKPIVKGKKGVTFGNTDAEKQKQRQSILTALADKKKQGKLALEDLDTKLDVIIEMLQDLMPPK